jgi:hypothetical protein
MALKKKTGRKAATAAKLRDLPSKKTVKAGTKGVEEVKK